ncbi:YheC/YheD family endospore coat-associated protein [Rummeliibacillus stabekisii]|uniref:YheC/YheD family endospore coat-associated protein n=1 Tax=Rummeliibacillus stabekisii TaxID=241244 RepID=UPI00117045A7|nr:YheC/YheD family protein [Rummeliibacillus stabekisii]MBB5171678.1 glutathione synthase/RimK-type ligase-like ATP-grasp enzyme [Rummeliibacillus stabekisii]GEL06285.1 endospore coat-associated protein YheC [Rummeliibacillus stabekisii]
MVIVAMLHYRKHPHKIKKAFICASVAKMEGIDFYFFSPSGVKFKEKTIQGYQYENGTWVLKEMPFPDVIYNVAGMKTSYQKKVSRRLKKIIPFTSHPIGNKMQVFEKIKTIPEYAHYLIPSETIKDPQDVLSALEQYKKIIIKPLSSSQGKGLIFIERIGDQIELLEGFHREVVSVTELRTKIETVINEKEYLVQPYISSRTKDGFPFDFRIHMQKNGYGEWAITLIYPRIGSDDGIISNISAGGYIGKLETFLEKEYGEESYDILRMLEQFPKRFLQKFEALYNNQFDELGIDIGIDENKRLWIFEVNWRPGLVYRELDAAMNTIPYAAYLANQKNSLD